MHTCEANKRVDKRRWTHNHGIKRKAGHRGNADALAARAGVKHLGRNDPTQGATGTAETEVIQPGHDDEPPLGALVGRHARREQRQQDRGDDEGQHVAQVAADQGPAPPGTVDEEDGAELRHEGNDAVDALVFEGVVAGDAYEKNKLVYRNHSQTVSCHSVTVFTMSRVWLPNHPKTKKGKGPFCGAYQSVHKSSPSNIGWPRRPSSAPTPGGHNTETGGETPIGS